MKRLNIELAVGLFMIVGLLCFAYLSIRLGDVQFLQDTTYPVQARFGSISGLKNGATVELAGVKIGKVASIRLDPGEYRAVVQLAIDRSVKLQEDSIASIRTSGIIGDRYVNISPGASEDYLKPGDELEETESAINLEELVSKYIFEKE